MRIQLLSSLLVLTTCAGWAQTAMKSSDGCDHAGNNSDWRVCQGNRAQKADKELNELYAKTMAKLSAADQATLRSLERTWVSYRDGQCKAEGAQYNGGTLEPGIEAGCLAKETQLRIADLHAAYDAP